MRTSEAVFFLSHTNPLPSPRLPAQTRGGGVTEQNNAWEPNLEARGPLPFPLATAIDGLREACETAPD